MSEMSAELYDALVSAGAAEDKARAAAAAVTELRDFEGKQRIEGRLQELTRRIELGFQESASKTDLRLNEMHRHLDIRFEQIQGTQRLHAWMLGTMTVVLLGLLLKLLTP
jgi:hypothetical protein